MQFVPNQVMGYDRAITVFSPDGRLLQVEYAKKAVGLAAMALGITCKDGVILMADRHRTDTLLVKNSIKKINRINNNIITTSAGIMSDARVLVKKCRIKAQEHKLTYGKEIDVESLVRYVADHEQMYTQIGGIRPFGISFIIGGIDKKGSQLFLTEPSGIYFKYKAKAVGVNSEEANKILEKNYKENMNIQNGIKLGLTVFKKVLGREFNLDRLETSIASANNIKEISVAELKKY